MNINSLISNLAPLIQGSAGIRPVARPVSIPDNVIRDTYNKGQAEQSQVSSLVYTRSAASGSALRQTGTPLGQAAPGDSAANTDTQVSSDNLSTQNKETESKDVNGPKKLNGELLSAPEKELLTKLQEVDQSVHAHEMAHLAAAGGYAKGGASYTYQRGPNGKNYAVGGEVQIDTSRAGTPAATTAKLQVVRRAALAPTDPSAQDQRVAAQASVRIAEVAQELMKIASQENKSLANSNGQAAAASGVGKDEMTANQIYSKGASFETAPAKSLAQSFPVGKLLQRYGSVTQKYPQTAPGGSLDLVG